MAPGRSTLKRILAALLVISVAALALVLAAHRWIDSRDPREILEAIPEGATMALGKINQTATRDGVAEWKLEAESGQYDASSQTMQLKNLAVTYFLKENETVVMKARDGVLNTDTNSMEASGQVSIDHAGYTLTTEELDYDHPSRKLSTQAGVRIEGQGMTLEAVSMTVDLTTDTAWMGGGVKGTLNGKLLE
ncbi:MAG: LPS export ABC transporter periplasmic protein LptC [Desulfobacterales bacterium]